MAREITKRIGLFDTPQGVASELEDAFHSVSLKLTSLNQYTVKKFSEFTRQIAYEIYEEIKSPNSKYFPDGGEDSHSIGWMESVGHPYSKAHPNPGALDHDFELIHKQYGQKRGSIFEDLSIINTSDAKGNPSYAVGFISEYAIQIWRYLKYGTEKMEARDVEIKLINDYLPRVYDQAREIIGKAVRSVDTLQSNPGRPV